VNETQESLSRNPDARSLDVIAPCFGARFSGVTSSLIAILPQQAKHMRIAAMGFHIPAEIPRVSFSSFFFRCWDYRWRIWHARRNVEMIAGLLLRHVLRFRLTLVFTSAAQREHTWITHFCCRRMDALIATTRKAASFLQRKAVVVYHGVNSSRFSPPVDRSAAWAATGLPGKYGIGIFGRIRPQKGTEEFIDALIEVLPRRPEWTAVLVGETTTEFQAFDRRLRRKIEDAGLAERIHFTGFLKDVNAIPEWYRALKVVVCASRIEGFGLSCLEAMASGCPVIATSTGAWPELISDGQDGYVVPCSDAAALSGAIMKMTEDPLRIEKMGERARQKIIGGYQIQNEEEGVRSVYKELLLDIGADSAKHARVENHDIRK
jgi:glycosyltransferase involved in cell wall biosynthesis